LIPTAGFATFLGLCSALGWGSADFCGGLASRRASTYSVLLVSELSGLLLLLPLPFIFKEPLPSLEVYFMTSLAGLGGTIGLFLLYRALAEGQMSVAAPISGLVAAIIPVAVGGIRQGLPQPATLTGFGLALVAIWFIARGNNDDPLVAYNFKQLLLPAVAGVTFGAYFVFTNLATREATFWPLVFSRTLSTVILGIYMLAARQPLKISSLPVRQATLGGSLDVLANLFYVLAGQLGRMDVTAMLGSLYPAGTVLLARMVLNERLSRAQGFGVAAALMAIALITI
jgi:drug/metabolite transporter (DMT)-like permease